MKHETYSFRPPSFLILTALLFCGIISSAQTCDPKYTGVECTGSTIQFTANSTGYNFWQWDFGDGNTTTGSFPANRDPVYAYRQNGTYRVKLTSLDSKGSLPSCTKEITVRILPSPIIDIQLISDTSQCFQDNKFCLVNYSTSPGGAGLFRTTYLVNDGAKYDMIGDDQTKIVCHKVIDPKGGWFDVRVEAEDSNGCSTTLKYTDMFNVYPDLGISFNATSEEVGDSIRAVFVNNTYLQSLKGKREHVPLNDVTQFSFDFGNEIVKGSSDSNTTFWTGQDMDGKIVHWYAQGVVIPPSLTVTSKFGCTDRYVEPITDSASQKHILKHAISGRFYVDKNQNCKPDLDELTENFQLSYFPGLLRMGSGQFQATALDSQNIRLEPVFNQRRHPYLKSFCPPYYDVLIHGDSEIDSTNYNFAVEYVNCPVLEVEVTSDRRRRCGRSLTQITYRNHGLLDAKNAQILYKQGEHINLISASRPFKYNADGILVFDIDTVKTRDQGVIFIFDSVSCIGGIRDVVQCSEVWITPTNDCLQNLDSNYQKDKSKLQVSGNCIGDSSAHFVISNVGLGDMPKENEYKILSPTDEIYSGTFELDKGDSLVLDMPSPYGKSIGLFVDEKIWKVEPLKFVIDGCGNNGVQKGSSVELSNPFSAPILEYDKDCQRIRDSYDPNDKRVQPEGLGYYHKVLPETELNYTIRFQNTGNDTAYQVVITDDLHWALDLSSLKIGMSSHPFEFEIDTRFNKRMLVFTFNNIYLVDSITDEANSHGYISFKISPNIKYVNSRITNKANIYFDYNEPVVTNEVYVTPMEEMPKGGPITIEENNVLRQLVVSENIEACDTVKSFDGKRKWWYNGVHYDTLSSGQIPDTIYVISRNITLMDTSVIRIDNYLESQNDKGDYQWLSCTSGYAVIDGENQATFYPAKNGSYAVALHNNNCYDTSQCFEVSGFVSTSNISTSLRLFPNPTSGVITLDVSKLGNAFDLSVVTMNGREILQKKYGIRESIGVDLTNEASGIYLIRVLDSSGLLWLNKVIKE